MADLSSAMPVEPQKADYLHERSRIPAAPHASVVGLVRQNLTLVLSVAFTVGFFALAVQTRAGWDSRRDWVIPAAAQGAAIGAIAVAYLVTRKRVLAILPVAVLLVLAAGLTALNIWRGYETTGGDGLRNAMTIVTAVVIALALGSAFVTMLVVEGTNPTRPPAPPEE
ncbi:MAG: hypothetical protein HYX53_01460 [Chloroflexi bacterium]|nr:hypothetical protein [Chloroflexota bacterium]